MNESLVNIFLELVEYYSWKNEKYRSEAFQTAANSLNSIDVPITSIEQVSNLEGVGKSSIEIIKLYLENKPIPRLLELREEFKEKFL